MSANDSSSDGSHQSHHACHALECWHLAGCQVFAKADIDEVNLLTRAIAADAIADDASAHTVDVLTDVSDQPGQLAQPTAPREASEASAPSARQRPADLEVAEEKEVKAPRAIRRDSTLTIPSPSARDAEVMHSNEAGTAISTPW